MYIDNIDNINDINKIINYILKDRSQFDIIKDYKNINSLCEDIVKMSYSNIDIDKNYKNIIIQKVLNQININGMSLNEIQAKHNERYSNTKFYDDLSDILNYLKIFPVKKLKLDIDNEQIDINVFDTGNEYIPAERRIYTEKIMKYLKKLKDEEKIKQLADILTNGIASIYLTPEEKEKILEEIKERNKNNEFEIKNDYSNFNRQEYTKDEENYRKLR